MGLAQGQDFAGYRIERLLGAGGMGEVYLARDRDLPRWVALKLLAGSVTHDPGVRARFQREADTAARLAHPNIVSVHARGEHAGQLWIAMEYVDGTDVAALLRNGPFPPDYAVWVLAEAARALDHAHQQNTLHRDVKPANIMVTGGPHPRVLLADFGNAKALDESVAITRTGEVYASFRYAAPEQLDPTVAADRRADVYALGGAFYHMLTGVHPFPATTTAQLIHSHLNLPVPPPSGHNPALPGGFDAVIATAMAKNPQERFGSCGELAAAAVEVLHRPGGYGAGVPDMPAPGPARPRRGRKALIVAAAIGVVVALAGAGTAVLLATNKARDADQLMSRQDDRQALEARACEIGELMLTTDHRNAETAIPKLIDNSTGQFKSEYERQRESLVTLLQQSQVTSEVGEIRCYYKSGDERRAEVLFTGNQKYSNAANPNPTTKPWTLTMTLEKVDGRWLCSDTEIPTG
ncbi:MAG: serine/threonine protein kinase [Nocardia sp.]|nr:serine/threonine protein kinase [Nocardia sp.]